MKTINRTTSNIRFDVASLETQGILLESWTIRPSKISLESAENSRQIMLEHIQTLTANLQAMEGLIQKERERRIELAQIDIDYQVEFSDVYDSVINPV